MSGSFGLRLGRALGMLARLVAWLLALLDMCICYGCGFMPERNEKIGKEAAANRWKTPYNEYRTYRINSELGISISVYVVTSRPAKRRRMA